MSGAPEYRSKRMRALHGLRPRPKRIVQPPLPYVENPAKPFQPWRMEAALDIADLWDPDLSMQLEVAIGTVDEWEVGISTPTREQQDKLAELTGFDIRWFHDPTPPEEITTFICGTGGGVVKTTYARVSEIGPPRWMCVHARPDLKKRRKPKGQPITQGLLL